MISLLPKQHFFGGNFGRKIKEENKEFFIKGVQRFYAAVFGGFLGKLMTRIVIFTGFFFPVNSKKLGIDLLLCFVSLNT